MITRAARNRLPPILAVACLSILVACTPGAAPSASTSSGPSVPTAASPGEGLGSLPGVEGWAYRAESDAVPGFLSGANQSLDGDAEVSIVQASAATRGDDEVSLIAFSFPGTTDADAIDYFARVLDDMEDGFQAGSQRGLGGGAYVMANEGRTVVLAPWGRAEHLVFLFALGPTGPTEELVSAILGVEG
jgi:hypothetical protein